MFSSTLFKCLAITIRIANSPARAANSIPVRSLSFTIQPH
nr:MAG TPA: hypothetical protein [Caudoviricetes sp.]